MNTDIGVIIVTYNRLSKLKQALMSFEKQTFFPSYLLVVDNASTDGTGEYLKTWKRESGAFDKIVITMKENRGGSGGFYTGLKKGLSLAADWLWVSDDDAFPCVDALYKTHEYLRQNMERVGTLSAICGQVINHGKIDIAHRKIYGKKSITITETFVPEKEYEKTEFELNAFTYVGTIMNKEKLKKAGLPNRDFFIWWDDLEHGLRMSKIGKIVCVPAIKIHHDVDENGSSVSWKSYYGYRNMTATYKKYFPGFCYWYFCFKVWVKIIFNFLTGRKIEEINILQDGFFDAIRNRFGIHAVYRPGWVSAEHQRKLK